MGMEWEWNGNGMGMEWEWNGNGMGMEWEWNGISGSASACWIMVQKAPNDDARVLSGWYSLCQFGQVQCHWWHRCWNINQYEIPPWQGPWRVRSTTVQQGFVWAIFFRQRKHHPDIAKRSVVHWSDILPARRFLLESDANISGPVRTSKKKLLMFGCVWICAKGTCSNIHYPWSWHSLDIFGLSLGTLHVFQKNTD